MKKSFTIITTLLLSLGLSQLKADEFSNNFKTNLTEVSLDALTEDLGALVGGGSFHQGRGLGFPIGFDVGVHVPIVGVQGSNPILKDDGSTIEAIWGQAELGLPARLNIIGRGGKVFDADLVGGGIRYGLINPSLPGLPAVSIIGLYNQLEHDLFEMETLTFNAVLSIDLPFVHPYVGIGYDTSKLDPTAQAFSGVSQLISRDLEGEADGYRAEAGVNLSIFPFTYLSLGAGLANDREMYHVGAGVKF